MSCPLPIVPAAGVPSAERRHGHRDRRGGCPRVIATVVVGNELCCHRPAQSRSIDPEAPREDASVTVSWYVPPAISCARVGDLAQEHGRCIECARLRKVNRIDPARDRRRLGTLVLNSERDAQVLTDGGVRGSYGVNRDRRQVRRRCDCAQDGGRRADARLEEGGRSFGQVHRRETAAYPCIGNHLEAVAYTWAITAFQVGLECAGQRRRARHTQLAEFPRRGSTPQLHVERARGAWAKFPPTDSVLAGPIVTWPAFVKPAAALEGRRRM